METILEWVLIWRSLSSRLIHQVRNALSRLVHLLDTQKSGPIDDEFPTLQSRPVTLVQELKENEVPSTSFSDSYFQTIYVQSQSHPASHIPADKNLKNGLVANDWIIQAVESQALDNLVVPLPSSKYCNSGMWGILSANPCSVKPVTLAHVSMKMTMDFWRRQNPQIPELQQTIIPNSLRESLCMMAYYHK